jgi:maleylacetate reductase
VAGGPTAPGPPAIGSPGGERAAQPAHRLRTFRYEPGGPRIVFGPGTASELAAELDLLGIERVLLLAGRPSPAADALGGRIAGHVTAIRRHVPVAGARAAVEYAREVRADGLLSIGGGSATGTAKAVALETGLPIVAVPITYAGSEMTSVYGLTENGVKRTGRSPRVLPRTVVYDPALAVGLPYRLSVLSAVNALAHCAGGMYAAGATPISDLLALEGVRELAAGLHALAASPQDVNARYRLSYGACLAGTVLNSAGSGLHHTICHVLGGAHDLPHAETHTAVLPHALRHLQEHDPEPAARIAAVLAAPNGDAATAVLTLTHSVQPPVTLRELGLTEQHLPAVADQLAARLAPPGTSGPDRATLLGILRAAL